jgi:hypothetical protein
VVALVDRDDAVREVATELSEDHAGYVIDVSSEACIDAGA